MKPDHLTDAEVREICDGLEQPAAMVRYFKSIGVKVVHRKPNGMPLVGRDAYRQALGATTAEAPAGERPNRARLLELVGRRA